MVDPELYAAVCNDDLEGAKQILNKGVNPKSTNHFNQTVLFCVRSVEMMDILLGHGVSLDKPDVHGITPFFRKMQESYFHVQYSTEESKQQFLALIKHFLQLGANVNVKEHSQSNTPLFECPNMELASLLLDYGADPTVRNKFNKTPAECHYYLRDLENISQNHLFPKSAMKIN